MNIKINHFSSRSAGSGFSIEETEHSRTAGNSRQALQCVRELPGVLQYSFCSLMSSCIMQMNMQRHNSTHCIPTALYADRGLDCRGLQLTDYRTSRVAIYFALQLSFGAKENHVTMSNRENVNVFH